MNRVALSFARPADRQATRPPEERGLPRDGVRLLVTTALGNRHATFSDLPRLLAPGTLLVVNRSAAVAASLPAEGARGALRVNLATRYGAGLWLAEPRVSSAAPGPLPLSAGDTITVAGLTSRLVAPYPGLERLWFIRIEGDVDRAMRTAGEPIRYGYLEPPYPGLDAYQTVFGDVPGSAEMSSAARPFTRRLVNELRAARIRIAWVVLHAGVSSLELEAEQIEAQPLIPEPFLVPRRTAAAVNEAQHERRRVVAVGTTVVRALESARAGHRVQHRRGFTRRFVRPGNGTHVVDGLLTGLHDPLTSHLALLYALAGEMLIRDAYSEAVRKGYLWHEFGDSHLILPSAA